LIQRASKSGRKVILNPNLHNFHWLRD